MEKYNEEQLRKDLKIYLRKLKFKLFWHKIYWGIRKWL